MTSYDLLGKELWKIKGKSILAIPTPFAHRRLAVRGVRPRLWGEHRIYAIRPGAKGRHFADRRQTARLATSSWFQKIGPYHPTPLIVGDNLYMLFDRGFMMCFDAKTGKQIFDKQRLPKGNAFTSSPWSYADKLFCLNEDGVTFVVQTGPKFKCCTPTRSLKTTCAWRRP